MNKSGNLVSKARSFVRSRVRRSQPGKNFKNNLLTFVRPQIVRFDNEWQNTANPCVSQFCSLLGGHRASLCENPTQELPGGLGRALNTYRIRKLFRAIQQREKLIDEHRARRGGERRDESKPQRLLR